MPGIKDEHFTQKVARATAWHGGIDSGTGNLRSAIIYRGAKFSFRTIFARSKEWSLEAFGFIFTDPDFTALRSGFILAFGLVIIAIPLGGILAF